jgi:hypothetical protein
MSGITTRLVMLPGDTPPTVEALPYGSAEAAVQFNIGDGNYVVLQGPASMLHDLLTEAALAVEATVPTAPPFGSSAWQAEAGCACGPLLNIFSGGEVQHLDSCPLIEVRTEESYKEAIVAAVASGGPSRRDVDRTLRQ